jgi:hypothetical protein
MSYLHVQLSNNYPLRELRRAWLYLVAFIDFHQIYAKRILYSEDPDPDSQNEWMGCFAYNPTIAFESLKAELRMFLIWPCQSFRNETILSIVNFTMPGAQGICMLAASPPYTHIDRGQAGSKDKVAAIVTNSVTSVAVMGA